MDKKRYEKKVQFDIHPNRVQTALAKDPLFEEAVRTELFKKVKALIDLETLWDLPEQRPSVVPSSSTFKVNVESERNVYRTYDNEYTKTKEQKNESL